MAAEHERSGTFSADGQSDWFRMQHGGGFLLLDSSQGNGFGGGTLSLEIMPPWGTEKAIKSYLSEPIPNPDGIELKAGAEVRVKLAGSTSPTLRWWLKDGGQG